MIRRERGIGHHAVEVVSCPLLMEFFFYPLQKNTLLLAFRCVRDRLFKTQRMLARRDREKRYTEEPSLCCIGCISFAHQLSGWVEFSLHEFSLQTTGRRDVFCVD